MAESRAGSERVDANERGGELDKLLSLFSSLESAIRHLLSGAVIATIWFLSRKDPACIVSQMLDHLGFAIACVVVIGVAAFSIYRLVLWIIGDCIAFRLGWSAPALLSKEFKESDRGYTRPYAQFLEWRYWDKPGMPDKLSGYLNYRWSVAHLAVVSASACLFISFWFTQAGSLLDNSSCLARTVALAVLVLGLVQVRFLYNVERELCDLRPPLKSGSAPLTEGAPNSPATPPGGPRETPANPST